MKKFLVLLLSTALTVPAFSQSFSPPSGGVPSGAAGGGLTGTYPNPTVATVPSTALPAFTGDCAATAGTSVLTCTKTNGNAIGQYAINVSGVNFNSANTDTTITIPAAVNGAYAVNQVVLYNCTATLGTATFGIFASAGGGLPALVASGSSTSGITSTTVATAGSSSNGGGVAGIWLNQPSIFFRVQTAQGSPATCSISVRINNL